MNTDDLFITPSSKSSEFDCVPLLVSSTAETPELNTNIPSKLIITGMKLSYFPYNYNEQLYSVTKIIFKGLTIVDDGILQNSLQGMNNLISVSFPKLTTIGTYGLSFAFSYCENLTSVSFPEVTTIGAGGLQYAFYRSYAINSVSFPKLTTVTYPKTAFYQMGSSTLTVHLPKALSSLGITNNGGSNSSNYCSFVYDL